MRPNLHAGKVFACLVLLIAITLLSCHKTAPSPASKPLQLPQNSAAVVAASNQFAIDLFRTVLQQTPDNSNILVSPLSIYTALSMVYNGAAAATKDSMTRTLALTGIPISQLNAVSKALLEQMPHEDSKVQLSIANSIWYDQHRGQPLPGFLDILKRDFNAIVQPLNFGDPAAKNTINSWVAQHTNNKIPSIIDNISGDALMLLINAVYFNGTWKYAFKTSETRPGAFTRADGTSINTPFMHQKVGLRTHTGPTFTVAELPYGTGNSFNMYVVLPKDRQQPINSFAASLDQSALSDMITHLDSAEITLSIPKWEYSYSIDDMKPALSALGMGIAFSELADFSGIYSPANGIAITRALHKTYIKVNESGTEAAAATAVEIGYTSVLLNSLTLDHPFVYVITEKQTGSLLFMGLLNDPGKN